MKAKHDYKTEEQLCATLIEEARACGWLVFPETSEYDLLMVATSEVRTHNIRTGEQIGVHAKLHANIEVLYQALPMMHRDRGPSYHAILVPVASQEFRSVAHRCGIIVLEGAKYHRAHREYRRSTGSDLLYLPAHQRQYYSEPLWYPEMEINTPAGVRSPKKITPWKVNAVRLCLEAIEKGFVLNADFRTAGISMTLWRQKKWIVATDQHIGKSIKYVINESADPPHKQWPEIAEKLREDGRTGQSRNQLRRLGITK